LASNARLRFSDQLHDEFRHAEEIVESSARNRIAAAIDDHGGFDDKSNDRDVPRLDRLVGLVPKTSRGRGPSASLRVNKPRPYLGREGWPRKVAERTGRNACPTLSRGPGFTVLLGEELVGFGVVHELLFVAVPAQFAA
jgi:hypothetical protein